MQGANPTSINPNQTREHRVLSKLRQKQGISSSVDLITGSSRLCSTVSLPASVLQHHQPIHSDLSSASNIVLLPSEQIIPREQVSQFIDTAPLKTSAHAQTAPLSPCSLLFLPLSSSLTPLLLSIRPRIFPFLFLFPCHFQPVQRQFARSLGDGSDGFKILSPRATNRFLHAASFVKSRPNVATGIVKRVSSGTRSHFRRSRHSCRSLFPSYSSSLFFFFFPQFCRILASGKGRIFSMNPLSSSLSFLFSGFFAEYSREEGRNNYEDKGEGFEGGCYGETRLTHVQELNVCWKRLQRNGPWR